MLIITEPIYQNIAKIVVENIGQRYFFSGTVEYDTEELYSTLVTTLLIDKKRITEPDGAREVIVDIIPVWWEFKTFQREGEVSNSFSWQEFKEFLPINKIE